VLAIRSITLTDFGPFKDEQRIEFPADAGVSIIYGENMRGKTYAAQCYPLCPLWQSNHSWRW
jgi:hypothetical protein